MKDINAAICWWCWLYFLCKFCFSTTLLTKPNQLGISFFLTLSFAHSRWDELKGEFSQDEVKKISYFYRCEWLNSNPVLLARYFQFRVENFEFQTRGFMFIAFCRKTCLCWIQIVWITMQILLILSFRQTFQMNQHNCKS